MSGRDKERMICVGCAPSTGSTLLADLLDAVPGVICGPELNIFCIPDAYRWDDGFIEAARRRIPFLIDYSIARQSQFFNTRHLDSVGLTPAALDELIEGAGSLQRFTADFVDHYRRVRDRPSALLADKGPLNLPCAPLFIEHFPDSLFVVLVRDGRSVVSSLRRRGHTLYEAALCWLWETRVGEHVVDASQQAIEVRYEDLVDDPFEIVADLAGRLMTRPDPSRIADRFRRNSYRERLDRVDSWRAPEYPGEVVRGYGFQELTTDELAFLESLVLIRPDGSRVDFRETLTRHGYDSVGSSCDDLDVLERYAAEYIDGSQYRDLHTGYELVLRDVELDAQRAVIDGLGARARQPHPPSGR